MSLVAAYGDSESENSNDYVENIETNRLLETPSPVEHSSDEETSNINTVPTNQTSFPTHETNIQEEKEEADKLPIPGFLTKNNGSHNGYLPTRSVFSNPFTEAENAKKSALEKHVKMVEGATAITINGKKVCWNYRKGRCRFGHNCKFAHDSDLQKSAAQLAAEHQVQTKVICQIDNAGPNQSVAANMHISEDEEAGNVKKRKRPGLAQGLIPGNKVLRQYHKLKKHHH